MFRNLSVEKNRHMYIRLFPEPTRIAKEQPPIARFILRVTATGGLNRRPYISPSMLVFFVLELCFGLDYVGVNMVRFLG